MGLNTCEYRTVLYVYIKFSIFDSWHFSQWQECFQYKRDCRATKMIKEDLLMRVEDKTISPEQQQQQQHYI